MKLRKIFKRYYLLFSRQINMANDYSYLDDNVRAEFEKQQKLNKSLAEAWKNRTLGRGLKDLFLDCWAEELSADSVGSYVSAIGSLITDQLLYGSVGSVSDNLSEGFIYVGEEEAMKVEILAIEGSVLYKEAKKGSYLGKDGFVEISQSLLIHQLRTYSEDPTAFLAIPYLADSLRRGELNFYNLRLEYVTEENDVIRVILDDGSDNLPQYI